ncbi:CHAP domain-containing protein [Novosphingobium kunmingense]|uniref:CHAP domain-containing protein n=1 Tax=Novosphingobium kunmingense TaxID=1211806 RepID=A0A2N0HKG5_9SPHN|nr:CHAP domain-containing protein [Novosphingobium kunmingense]PKB19432.1 CHAP domain-containing protein [Novosphingobium kunmingense]
MFRRPFLFAALIAAASPALAEPVIEDSRLVSGGGSSVLPPYLQCVPYARQISGIAIYGDAHTWWDKAEGRYARGTHPRVGAVMAFKPHGNSTLGHVAAVSRVVDDRTVLIRHANWSPIGGRRGQIEDDVKVIDVSDQGDWSEVRVWYAPAGRLGGSRWPLQGFIYPGKPATGEAKPRASSPFHDPIAAIIKRRMGW